MKFQTITRRAFVIATIGVALALAAPDGYAQSATSLRDSGQAGERWDGYLEARDASAKAAVESINAQRRKLYEERATAQGISAEVVGKVYAQELFDKLPPGSWFKQPDGEWIQK